MKKKTYSTPSVEIHNFSVATVICTSGEVIVVTGGGDSGIDYGGGSTEPAHTPRYDKWEDWEEWDDWEKDEKMQS